MAQVAERRMTATEFAQLGETNQIMELIAGEVIMTLAPTHDHQVVAIAFIDLLKNIAPEGERGVAPDDVYLDRHTVVQPDVFWVSKGNTACTLTKDGRFHGAPDLVIEVVSPDTELRDRRDKYRIYEKNRVPEYWICDAMAQFVEVYQLDKSKYLRVGVFGADESFDSKVLGVEVELSKIFII